MNENPQLDRGFAVWWWLAFALSAPLFLRTLWERTALTWREGPQNVGFSLAHLHPEFLMIGFLGYVAMWAWLITIGVVAARRRSLPSGFQLVYFVITALAVIISFVPYQLWAALGGVAVNP